MGAWGFNVLQDDTASDVYHDFIAAFNQRLPLAEILRQVRELHAESLNDPDEAPIFWLAIAKASWDCGLLTPETEQRVSEIVSRGEGLDRWADEGPKVLAKRVDSLRRFLLQLKTVNARPRKPKLPVQRKPVFAAGDCLAIRLRDGRFGAAIVLAAEQPDETRKKETYGTNLIGQLRFLSNKPPTPEIFERREWFEFPENRRFGSDQRNIVYVSRNRFRHAKGMFEIVCRTEITTNDPHDSYVWSAATFADAILR